MIFHRNELKMAGSSAEQTIIVIGKIQDYPY